MYWPLPTLADTHEEPDPATRASDWFEMVGPIMSDLTPMSGVWWSRVVAEARAWYELWTQSPAVERGLLRPNPLQELQSLRYRRLESRAYAMLLAATPGTIREEVVANRETHCVALLYHVLRTYQPGGLQERTALLEVLTNPGTTTQAAEAVQNLRGWGRALNRAMSMQVSIPDASLMLRGLDLLADPLLKKHPHVSFRCSQARTSLQLDHRPSLHSVREFVKVVQAEFDMLSLASSPDPSKKPKLAAMQQSNQDGVTSKGKDAGGKGGEGKGKRKGVSHCNHSNSLKEMRSRPRVITKEMGREKGKSADSTLRPADAHEGGNARSSTNTARQKVNRGATIVDQRNTARMPVPGQMGRVRRQGSRRGRDKRGRLIRRPQAKGLMLQFPLHLSASVASTGSTNKPSGDNGAAAPGGVPANPNKNQPSGSQNQTVANAQAQVLEEAQKLLKSLRIASLRVDGESNENPERK